MPSALHLPVELLYEIAGYLDGPADLSSWTRSSRAFHATLAPLLYRYVKDDPAVMCWACDEGRVDIVQRLLDAGANPNVAWIQSDSRWLTLRELHYAHCLQSQPFEGEREYHSFIRRGDYRVNFIRGLPLWIRQHIGFDRYIMDYFLEDGYSLYSHGPPASLTFPDQCYWTPLHIAVAWGNDELVNLLLDNGADINALSRHFCQCALLPDINVAPLWTPLHTAMCHGHKSTTRLLLSRGASINLTTRYGGKDNNRFTALHSACNANFLDAVLAVLDGGYQADVTVRDHNGMTPLTYAFCRGNWAIIDLLLEHGADINDELGSFNALGHACLLGYYAEALRLLDLGAIPKPYLFENRSDPIWFHLIAAAGAPDISSPRSSAQTEYRQELVVRLIEHGIGVDERAANGATALMEAASFHRADVVKALLSLGADVHLVDGPPWPTGALQKAVMLESEEVQRTPKGAMLNTVHAVLQAMEEATCSTTIGLNMGPKGIGLDEPTDVHIAKAFGLLCILPRPHEDKSKVAALLLPYKKAIDSVFEARPDLITATIMETNYDVAKLLLDRGFAPPCNIMLDMLIYEFITNDVSRGLHYMLKQFPETTPQILSSQSLFEAVDAGSGYCLEFLIRQGVSISCRNEKGDSLLFVACMSGDDSTVEVLLKNGADPDEYTQDGRLLTTVVALGQSTEMIRVFLEYGASVHSVPQASKKSPDSDMSLLDMAITNGLDEIVEEIVCHENYPTPTDEEISTHWQTLMDAPKNPAALLNSLLYSSTFDVNQIFTIPIPDDHAGNVLTTPLCLCVALNRLDDKVELIGELVSNGADIHKLLPVRPNSQNHILRPECELKYKVLCELEGTTPFGWAIENSSMRLVRIMLTTPWIYGNPQRHNTEATQTLEHGSDFMLSYAKAACRRQDPMIFSLLFKHGLDRTIQDEDSNTLVHMICDCAETFRPSGANPWALESAAEQSAFCLVACVQRGVPYQQKNKKGASGADRVLEISNYSGDCRYRRKLAEKYRLKIAFTNEPNLQLTAKCPALDDSDGEEDVFDSDDDSDDEEFFDEDFFAELNDGDANFFTWTGNDTWDDEDDESNEDEEE
ncbi:hypothetical protein RRF57_007218 [Xylaria bambusicola]|uniref:F-box domain-containing protein n=1 Tax=Xylaria bambusicola TaxID=326684 RepID=A0AAN7V0A4_9PEZI